MWEWFASMAAAAFILYILMGIWRLQERVRRSEARLRRAERLLGLSDDVDNDDTEHPS